MTLFAVVAAGSAVALALGLSAVRSDENGKAADAVVQRGDVEIKIIETGEMRSADQATISASTDKQIIWLAPEGTWVKKGDPLVRLAAEKYEIAKSAAESALRVEKAQLREAQSALEGRRAVEEQARLEYSSLPELAEKGYINRSEVEQARLSYEQERSATRAKHAAVAAARANVERAKQDLRQQQRKLSGVEMHAPRDGLVVYATFGSRKDPKRISVGMVPFEGQDLMYLPDTSNMVIDTEISEFDLSRVQQGSQAKLLLAAYPDAEFRGEVARVSTLARPKISQVTGKPTGLKVFDVTLAVRDQDERLKPGLTATVEILVSHHPDVLFVPLAAVFLDEQDRTVVYPSNASNASNANNDSEHARAVEVLDSNDRVAIIASGLEEGEHVLLTPPRVL